MTGRIGTALAAMAAAAMLLGGCSAQAIKQDRRDRVAELGKFHVHAAPDVPSLAVLEANLGVPEVTEVSGLRFAMYPVGYEQGRKLQKQAMKAEKKSAKRDEKDKLGPGGYAALVLLSPIYVPAMVLAAPIAGADLAIGSAIVAAEGDDPRKKVTGVGALFVHDAEGNYRWHACCFRPNVLNDSLFDEKGPNIRRIPYGWRNKVKPEAAADLDGFRRDYRLVQCLRARAGDVIDQRTIFERFNATVPDPVPAYYWARAIAEGGGAPVFLERSEAKLSAEELAAAEAHYRANPLAEVDCAATADRLLQAESEGTKGPRG